MNGWMCAACHERGLGGLAEMDAHLAKCAVFRGQANNRGGTPPGAASACTDPDCPRRHTIEGGQPHPWHDVKAERAASLANPQQHRDNTPHCRVCGLMPQVRGCTPERCGSFVVDEVATFDDAEYRRLSALLDLPAARPCPTCDCRQDGTVNDGGETVRGCAAPDLLAQRDRLLALVWDTFDPAGKIRFTITTDVFRRVAALLAEPWAKPPP